MNFKKILSAIGMMAVASPVALTVVGCGKSNTTAAAPIINPSVKSTWGLDSYKTKPNKIWVNKNQLNMLNKKTLTMLLWTGAFDADDLDGVHDRQIKRFNDQKVDQHLNIINSEAIINQIKKTEGNSKLTLENIELKLDKDLYSKTKNPEDQTKVIDYLLTKSETTWNSLTVIFYSK